MSAHIRLISVLFLLFSPAIALQADDSVFARQGEVVLTQDELDAAFLQVPQNIRFQFIRDGEKVDQLVQSLLRYKQIAAAASAAGYDQETLVKARMALTGERELANAWLEKIVADAPGADYTALAHEQYLAHPELFMSEEMVDVSHILIGVGENRSDEAALELASRLRNELVESPALFDGYITEYSEDPGKSINQGHYPQVKRGQMVAPFEQTAFSMIEPGEISEPVKTSFGYHIIRLNKRMPSEVLPFDSIKETLSEEARNSYLFEYRKNYILSVSAGDIKISEGAVEAMAKRHFGENLELAPDFYNQ